MLCLLTLRKHDSCRCLSLSLAELTLSQHFAADGVFGSPSEEKCDLSLGYGTFHQLYRIDGILMAGIVFVCNAMLDVTVALCYLLCCDCIVFCAQ